MSFQLGQTTAMEEFETTPEILKSVRCSSLGDFFLYLKLITCQRSTIYFGINKFPNWGCYYTESEWISWHIRHHYLITHHERRTNSISRFGQTRQVQGDLIRNVRRQRANSTRRRRGWSAANQWHTKFSQLMVSQLSYATTALLRHLLWNIEKE